VVEFMGDLVERKVTKGVVLRAKLSDLFSSEDLDVLRKGRSAF
jgi:hypothetical protein